MRKFLLLGIIALAISVESCNKECGYCNKSVYKADNLGTVARVQADEMIELCGVQRQSSVIRDSIAGKETHISCQ